MAHLGPTLRRRRRASRPWKRVLAALVVSLALNALVLREVKVDFLGNKGGAEYRPVTLAPLSAQEWAANRALRGDARTAPRGPAAAIPAPPPLQPAEPPPPKTTPQAPGQVVDVAPSKDKTPPKDSRFVSDQNHSVEKETRSRFARPGFPNVLPKPSDPKAGAKPPAEVAKAGDGGRSGKSGNAAGEMRSSDGLPRSRDGKLHLPSQVAQQKLALGSAPNGAVEPKRDREEVRGEGLGQKLTVPGQSGDENGEGGHSGKPGPIDLSRLMPSADTYNRLPGGPAPDHLDGVEEGEETALNTREWKYATYFNRIKQAVATQWDPSSALLARDPTGKMFAYKDRITLVAVTLDQQGGLKQVEVEKTCGVDFLDHTAIDAFRKAQPFVNPPPGLVDGKGEIRFSFGFYLQVGSPLRIFRGPEP